MRYVTEEGLLKKELADIVPGKFADATGIFDAIKTGLDNICVTLKKCVCTNMDQGNRNGVTRKIAEAVPHNIVNTQAGVGHA